VTKRGPAFSEYWGGHVIVAVQPKCRVEFLENREELCAAIHFCYRNEHAETARSLSLVTEIGPSSSFARTLNPHERRRIADSACFASEEAPPQYAESPRRTQGHLDEGLIRRDQTRPSRRGALVLYQLGHRSRHLRGAALTHRPPGSEAQQLITPSRVAAWPDCPHCLTMDSKAPTPFGDLYRSNTARLCSWFGEHVRRSRG
jgi:hypothetical protein